MGTTVQKTPHELMFRFNKDGSVAGGHIQHLFTVYDNGQWVSESVGDAMPISMASEKDSEFPLDKILSDVHIGALKATEQAMSDVLLKSKEIESLKDQKEIMTKQQAIMTKQLEVAAISVESLKSEKG